MIGIHQFGEQVEGYSVPVLNEREIRAEATATLTETLSAKPRPLFAPEAKA